MKKTIVLAAVAVLGLIACQKEDNSTVTTKNLTLHATLEETIPEAKADLNSSNQIVWVDGDQIGVYVNDGGWADKNQEFDLAGGSGSSMGTFNWRWGSFDNTNAVYAFYPYNGNEGTSATNLNFGLNEAYYGYTSGLSLCPVVATMAYDSGLGEYNDLAFKYVGGAVKVVIKNLPGAAHSIGMQVSGKNIWGTFPVNPANAGTATITATSGSNDTVWLNYATDGNMVRSDAFTFIFPVPEVPASAYSFVVYDLIGRKVWEKTTPTQSAITRGDLLNFPQLTFDAGYDFYSGFSANASVSDVDVFFAGTPNSWGADRFTHYLGDWYVIKGVTFSANDEFKVRMSNKNWDSAYPASNYIVSEAGTYDIFFNNSNHSIEIWKRS